MTAITPPDFLSVREAAAVLRIGKTSAYDLAHEFVHTSGESGLKVFRVGRQLRVPRTALEELLGGSMTWPIAHHPTGDGSTEQATVLPSPNRHPKPQTTRSEQPLRLFPQ